MVEDEVREAVGIQIRHAEYEVGTRGRRDRLLAAVRSVRRQARQERVHADLGPAGAGGESEVGVGRNSDTRCTVAGAGQDAVGSLWATRRGCLAVVRTETLGRQPTATTGLRRVVVDPRRER